MYDRLSIMPVYSVTTWGAFAAKVLQIVEQERQAKINPTKTLTMLQFAQLKMHVFRLVKVSLGSGADSGQDVYLCSLCHTKFKRNQEKHEAYCIFST